MLIYAFGFEASGANELIPKAKENLLQPQGLRRFAAALKAIAAIDHVLPRTLAISLLNERRLPEMLGSELLTETVRKVIETQILARKLNERHIEAALQSWKKLRENELSPRALMDFEDKCLRPQYLK